MKQTAAGLAALGRGNDSILVHMTPREVQGLQTLAVAHGGSLTVNPHTGLPEAGFLQDILPTVVGVGLSLINPGLSPWLIGGASGLTALATGKSFDQALLSGLLSGGGAALFGPGADVAGSTGSGFGSAAGSSGNYAVDTLANINYAPSAPTPTLPGSPPAVISPSPDFSLSGGSLGAGFRGAPPDTALSSAIRSGMEPAQLGANLQLPVSSPAIATTPVNYSLSGGTPDLGLKMPPGAALTPEDYSLSTGRSNLGLNLPPPTYPAPASAPVAAAPKSFLDDPLAWAKANKPAAAALGLGAMGALGGFNPTPLNVPGQPQQPSNYRAQRPVQRPYDVTAPGGYFFTDRGVLQPAYAAKGGEMHSVPQLEDGGFVLTKRAVDGMGRGSNERGQRAAAAGLGAIPIRGPGSGTSDSIPTTIDGRRPALVSNGEAYVPRKHVKQAGGAKRLYALMRQAEQDAKRRAA